MKILINTTPPTNPGGVANHYKGLKAYWQEDVHYNYIGGRKGIPGSIIWVFDLIAFLFKCLFLQPDIVLLNPSLGKTALQRDALFLKISKRLGLKTIVFFHGWDERQAEQITQNPNAFVNTFNRADCFLVLASVFKNDLVKWGITRPIKRTTTKVDDNLVSDFKIEDKVYNKNILFLARVEKEKGIFITLQTFKILQKESPDATLTIAGDGSALLKAKQFVGENNIQGVIFKGYVRGDDLIDTYKNNSIYILPTYGEGMPTSVLEAMAFGLAIVSRPVGGMVDFFENGVMGYLVKSTKPNDFAKAMKKILLEPSALKKMGNYNYSFANKIFLASEISSQLEKLFHQVLQNSMSKSWHFYL